MPPIFWTQKQDIGPSNRAAFGISYDATRQRVVLFGGDPGGPPLADTWHWDGALWTQVADTGPAARRGHALAYDVERQHVILFGGASGSDHLGDTWMWDGSEWTQVADTGPQARAGHAIAWDGVGQRLLLFGGSASAGPLSDTWEWSGTEWTQVQDVGPSPRHGHAMAFDPTGSRVVMFGGAGADGTGLGDTWAWNDTAWTQVADTGPEPRVAAGIVGAAAVLLFGGVSSIDPALAAAERIIYGDSWHWDGSAWTKVQDMGPARRWGHGMAFRSEPGRVVLFGGSTVFAPAEDSDLASGLRSDTWEVPEAGGGAGSTGVEVAAVAVSPDSVASAGDAIDVTVTLTGAAPGDVTLSAAIFFDTGGGSWTPIDPPGFTIPGPIIVGAGYSSTQFTITRDTQPLTPGDYAIGVAVEGGTAMQGASFTVS